MKKIICLLFFIPFLFGCNKNEIAPVPTEKTYEVECKVDLVPIANTTLSGTVTYISKTSTVATATLSSPGWSVKETKWALKSGDKIGFKTNSSNVGNYKAYIIVDGGVQVFKSLASTLPINGDIELYYILP